jgi:hypothetical protein
MFVVMYRLLGVQALLNMLFALHLHDFLTVFLIISCRPGMNNCKISEDETTKALRAPENNISLGVRHDVATSGVCTTMTSRTVEGDMKSITTSGTPKVESNANVSNIAEMPKSSKKLQTSTSRNPDDVDHFRKHREKRKRMGFSDKGTRPNHFSLSNFSSLILMV